MSWKYLEETNPELAAFGIERFKCGVAYLATIRKDGSPRVHPVTPIVGQGHLFVFIGPTSPKRYDLCRDGRYAMHSVVNDWHVTNGEFFISGQAHLVEDAQTRALATLMFPFAISAIFEQDVLFELSVAKASSTIYASDKPIRQHWEKQN